MDLGLSDDELVSFDAGTEDEDNIPDQDTLDEAALIEPTEPEAHSIDEAEAQPFEVADIIASSGPEQSSIPAAHDAEPALPPVPPELGPFMNGSMPIPTTIRSGWHLPRPASKRVILTAHSNSIASWIKQDRLIDLVVEDLQELVTSDYERPVLRRLHGARG